MTYSLPTFETTSHFHQQGDRHKSCLALCVYKLLCNCRYEWNLLNFCVNSLTPRLSGTVFLEIHNYGVFYLFISLHQIQNHIHNKKFIKAARPLHEAYKSHSNPIKVINQWMFRTSSFLVVRAIGDTVEQEIFACRKFLRIPAHSRKFPAREYYRLTVGVFSFHWDF